MTEEGLKNYLLRYFESQFLVRTEVVGKFLVDGSNREIT